VLRWVALALVALTTFAVASPRVVFGAPATPHVRWGDRDHRTAAELAGWLEARGSSYERWAALHPEAATRLERPNDETWLILPPLHEWLDATLSAAGRPGISAAALLLAALAFGGVAWRRRTVPTGAQASTVVAVRRRAWGWWARAQSQAWTFVRRVSSQLRDAAAVRRPDRGAARARLAAGRRALATYRRAAAMRLAPQPGLSVAAAVRSIPFVPPLSGERLPPRRAGAPAAGRDSVVERPLQALPPRATARACEIRVWHGSVTSQFYALAGIDEVVAASWYFRAEGECPEQSPAVLAAHRALVEALVGSGWALEPGGTDDPWHLRRFRLPERASAC
jgi:hypothetical protein